MVIGRYRVERQIGEGGMGAVYLAQRVDEYRQRVAVKLMRCPLEKRDMLVRFHAERQTLAALSHPNIVTLLDGGTTEEGMPYLVMDYVEGQPIDEYCEARRLSINERLRLLLPVCDAVEHAHRNLVVHCDLKPGNILVTEEGTPKLLDFGIAKLLDPQALGMTAQMTQAGQRPFTPAYASPEQVRGAPVTTATDVYALGMVLYRLLTGRWPYRYGTESPAEMISAVCMQEPERPSAAIERGGAGETAKAWKRLEGDLDAIALKALRKEPEQRYGSVAEFAEDIRHHLEGRPVAARKGTWRYHATKFVLRNRAMVGAAALAAVATLAGAIGVIWQARVALAEKARAERRFEDVRKLTHFLLFDFHDAVQRLPGSTPVQQMLVERSLGHLDSLAREAGGDTGLRVELAEAYVRFGDVQGNPYNPNLGDTQGAMASYRKALAMTEAAGPEQAAKVRARAKAHLGDVLFLTQQVKEAVVETRQAAQILEKLAASRPRDVEVRIDLAACYEGLGDQLGKGLRDKTAAMECYRMSLAHWEEAARLDAANMRARRASAGLNMKLAEIQAETDPPGAMERVRRGLDVLARLPQAEQASVPSRRLEGALYRRQGDCRWEAQDKKGALDSYGKAVEIYQALAALDPTNSRAQFDLVAALNDLGQSLEAMGDLGGALRQYAQVADRLEALIKTDPGNSAWRANHAEMLVRIGGLLAQSGQAEEARRQTARGLRAAKELAERADAPPAELTRAARLLVMCEPEALREPQVAAAYARRAVQMTKEKDVYALDTLAEAYLQSGNAEAAREVIEKGLALVPAGADEGQSPWLRRLLEGKLKRLPAVKK